MAALIIKGSCDYLPWSNALDYRAAVPGAQLVYLRGAGHQAYGDQPASYLALVRALLQGKQLPIAPYAGDAVPGDYQGPSEAPASASQRQRYGDATATQTSSSPRPTSASPGPAWPCSSSHNTEACPSHSTPKGAKRRLS
jgi:hypothetical protein